MPEGEERIVLVAQAADLNPNAANETLELWPTDGNAPDLTDCARQMRHRAFE